jgi:hypothetical protein
VVIVLSVLQFKDSDYPVSSHFYYWLGYSCLLLFSDWWQRSLPSVYCYFLTGGSEAFLMFVVTFWLVAVRPSLCLLLLSDWWQWGFPRVYCYFLTGGSEAFLMFVVIFWLVAVRLPSCLLLLSDWWQRSFPCVYCYSRLTSINVQKKS